MPIPTVGDIVDAIIDLLAQDARRDPLELRADLETLGTDLPIDSLLAVEVLVQVEERFDVSLPPEVEAARNLRSVIRFAQAIHDLAVEREHQAGATA